MTAGRNLGKAVKVDETTYEQLRKLAAAEERTISAVLRRAIAAYSSAHSA